MDPTARQADDRSADTDQTLPTRGAGFISRRLALAYAGAAFAMAAVPGCAVQRRVNRNRWRHIIPIEGDEIVLGQLAAVDVENRFGSVSVIANPNQVQAEVEVRLRRPGGMSEAEYESLRDSTWYAAHTEDARGLRTLRVLVQGVPGREETLPAEVIVHMPTCDGLAVRTAGGDVRLTDVAGAIQVENGRGALRGGRIICLTDRPLLDPITMLSTHGNIILGCTPESKGDVELITDEGQAMFSSTEARVRNAQPAFKRWTGIVNNGDNRVLLRSLNGHVRMIVTERPHTIETSRVY